MGTSADFTLVAPDPNTHADALYKFAFGDYRPSRIRDSHYDWAASRIGLIDGEVATHVAIYDVGMRIGSAVVKTAGVNLVATREDPRGVGRPGASS